MRHVKNRTPLSGLFRPVIRPLAKSLSKGLSMGFVGLALLSGCSARVPTRVCEMPALVRTGDLDTDGFGGRNDGRLGLERDPIVRTAVQSTEYTFDRQRVIDGRPYSDFRVTTRTREMLRR